MRQTVEKALSRMPLSLTALPVLVNRRSSGCALPDLPTLSKSIMPSTLLCFLAFTFLLAFSREIK